MGLFLIYDIINGIKRRLFTFIGECNQHFSLDLTMLLDIIFYSYGYLADIKNKA